LSVAVLLDDETPLVRLRRTRVRRRRTEIRALAESPPTMPRSASSSRASRTARSQLPMVMMPTVAPSRRSMMGEGTCDAAGGVLLLQSVDDLLILRSGSRCSGRTWSCPEPRMKYAPFSSEPGSVRGSDELLVRRVVAKELRHLERGPRRRAPVHGPARSRRPRCSFGHDPVVHPDVEVREHEDRRLESLGEVKSLRRRTRSTRAGWRGRAGCAWCHRARRRRTS
jgi:hypothetical protein